MNDRSELAASWVAKAMLAVFVLAPLALIAGCVAIIAAYVHSEPSYERRCIEGVEYAFTIDPQPFLVAQPCVEFWFFALNVSYDAATLEAPRLRLLEWILGGPVDAAPRNPVVWAPRTAELDQYEAVFQCDGLIMEALASWSNVRADSQSYILPQLELMADDLNEACATFEFVPPGTPAAESQ